MKPTPAPAYVPLQLATPSDLPEEGTGAIAGALNALAADHWALYLKAKNYHWHVSGAHFRDLHLLFDEQATSLLAAVDPLAERVRKTGELTLKSLGQVRRLSGVSDDEDGVVAPLIMVRRLLADQRQLVSAMREAHELAANWGDVGTTSVLETLIDEAERRVWFLFETSQGLEATP